MADSPAMLKLQLFRGPFTMENAEESLEALRDAIKFISTKWDVKESMFYVRNGTANVAIGQMLYFNVASSTAPRELPPSLLRL